MRQEVQNYSPFSNLEVFKNTFEIAKRLAFEGQDFIPKAYHGKPMNIMCAYDLGLKFNLSVMQSLACVAVIDGKAGFFGDFTLGIVQASQDYEWIWENFLLDNNEKIIGAECIIKRRNHEPHRRIFTMEMAHAAGLLDKQSRRWPYSGWNKYPERMLQWRARSYCLRDRFAKELQGIPTIIDGEFEVVDNNKINSEPASDSTPKIPSSSNNPFLDKIKSVNGDIPKIENISDKEKINSVELKFYKPISGVNEKEVHVMSVGDLRVEIPPIREDQKTSDFIPIKDTLINENQILELNRLFIESGIIHKDENDPGHPNNLLKSKGFERLEDLPHYRADEWIEHLSKKYNI